MCGHAQLCMQGGAPPEGSLKQQRISPGLQAALDQQRLLGSVTQQHAPQLFGQQWLQQQQQPKLHAFHLADGSNSGSSTFSSEAGADPSFGDPSALFTAHTHLQLSRDPSCHSNELGALLDGSSNFISEQHLQQHFRQQQQQQQPGQHGFTLQQQPALVPIMLPAQLAGDLQLDPQQQQLLRQLSNSTQNSQHSQPGVGGASTSGSPAGDTHAGHGQHSHAGQGQHAHAGQNHFATTSPANSSQTPAAEEAEQGGTDGGKYSMPVAHLKVACGDMVGTLMVHKARILIYEGTDREKEVSPTEFERLGGRSATKKWKQSIRLIGEDGE